MKVNSAFRTGLKFVEAAKDIGFMKKAYIISNDILISDLSYE